MRRPAWREYNRIRRTEQEKRGSRSHTKKPTVHPAIGRLVLDTEPLMSAWQILQEKGLTIAPPFLEYVGSSAMKSGPADHFKKVAKVLEPEQLWQPQTAFINRPSSPGSDPVVLCVKDRAASRYNVGVKTSPQESRGWGIAGLSRALGVPDGETVYRREGVLTLAYIDIPDLRASAAAMDRAWEGAHALKEHETALNMKLTFGPVGLQPEWCRQPFDPFSTEPSLNK